MDRCINQGPFIFEKCWFLSSSTKATKRILKKNLMVYTKSAWSTNYFCVVQMLTLWKFPAGFFTLTCKNSSRLLLDLEALLHPPGVIPCWDEWVGVNIILACAWTDFKAGRSGRLHLVSASAAQGWLCCWKVLFGFYNGDKKFKCNFFH